MRTLTFHRIAVGATIALVTAGAALTAQQPAAASGPKFQISFAAGAHAEPVTGRVYVAISRTNDRAPIQQADSTGAPLFSRNIEALKPGAPVVIDAGDLGHPVPSLREIPAGDYWVQPFVNVYTKFARADGHTVWLHMDQWEGQNWRRSPGNLYGDPVRVHIEPKDSAPITLVADKVIAPIAPIPDTDTVKRIKIQSQILTKWWGQPIFIGATITLPPGYDTHPDVKYPVIYSQGHFSTGAPGGGGGRGGPSTGSGRGRGAEAPAAPAGPQPRVIWVSLQHPSPYYDDSYGVNSANNGPFGDAIMQELLPAVETKFRVIREPWARILTGGSTGGWIALAHQVFYPDYYGGTFALCPDAVDFRYHQIVNIYDDPNAYWIDRGWTTVERPDQRRPDGNIVTMMKDENWFELVQGDRSRSGGQWDIWEATYGPVGPDGYPKPIWDKKTGAIDKTVAAYWKEHFDLRAILEKNWATLGPRVANKINVYVGDGDSYYLNMGVRMLQTFLKTADAPKWTGEILIEPMQPHCWGPRGPELMQKMVAQIEKMAPAGAELTKWKY